MIRHVACLVVLHCFAPAVLADSAMPILALGGPDPVALVRGTEVPGDPAITVERYIYLYRFGSEESRETFLANPERYEIQLGGGCGRMGPLSGRGAPGRFHVHDGRIYVFASEGCRETFKKMPQSFVPIADPPVQADAAASLQGTQLMDAAVGALGGAERLRSLKSLRFVRESATEVPNAADRMDGESRLVKFGALPDALFELCKDQWYGDSRFAYVMSGDEAFYAPSKRAPEVLTESATGELLSEFRRVPSVAAAEYVRGGKTRAIRIGSGTVGESAVEHVAIVLDGRTTTYGVEPKTGRILYSRYRGRGPGLWFGVIEESFEDFRDVGGISLPFKIERSFDGAPAEKFGTTWDAIEVDGAVDDGLFRPATAESRAASAGDK